MGQRLASPCTSMVALTHSGALPCIYGSSALSFCDRKRTAVSAVRRLSFGYRIDSPGRNRTFTSRRCSLVSTFPMGSPVLGGSRGGGGSGDAASGGAGASSSLEAVGGDAESDVSNLPAG